MERFIASSSRGGEAPSPRPVELWHVRAQPRVPKGSGVPSPRLAAPRPRREPATLPPGGSETQVSTILFLGTATGIHDFLPSLMCTTSLMSMIHHNSHFRRSTCNHGVAAGPARQPLFCLVWRSQVSGSLGSHFHLGGGYVATDIIGGEARIAPRRA